MKKEIKGFKGKVVLKAGSKKGGKKVMKKKLSDLEREFVEKVRNKTIKEVIAEYREHEELQIFDLEGSLMEMSDSIITLEETFFRQILKDDDFLDMPILAIAIDDGDCGERYMLALEHIGNGYYKTVNFDVCVISLSITLISAYENIELGCDTVSEFINNMSDEIDISRYL